MLQVLDCLMELPLFSGISTRGLRKVTDVEQPIREVEAITSVRGSARGLSAPIGCIYAVHFLDGTLREVFIWGDPVHRDFETATFLKPGRKTNVFSEVRDLMIKDPRQAVPHSVVESLRQYETVRDTVAAARPQFG